MEFEWDEAKRLQVIAKHGIDFIDALQIFDGPVFTKPDIRADYGELRHIAIGLVAGNCMVVVYTDRRDVRRLISAWVGGRKEYGQYQAYVAGRSEGPHQGGTD